MCKEPGPPVVYEWSGGRWRTRSTVHPRGCMGARRPHLDVPVPPGDPCGLREMLGRGGHRLRAYRSGDDLEVDLSGLLGYPCVVLVEGAPGWLGRRVFVMVSRSGRLYLAPS